MKKYIPHLFRSHNIWILWRKEKDKNGRDTKVPYTASGHYASSTNRSTWCSFDKAYDALRTDSFSGLGVVIAEKLGCVFIDIDHCIDPVTGELSEIASDILSHFPETYAEISQSGEGIHIFALGTIQRSFKNSNNGVEMYSGGRYCAFTGNAMQPYEVTENQPGLDYVFDKYKTEAQPVLSLPKGECLRSDESVIERAMERGHFRDLFHGKWEGIYPSRSEADLSMCCVLAFWADRDPEVIDRIFRSSDLYRAKWDEKHGEQTYGDMTIRKALAAVTEGYTDWKRRKADEYAQCILSKW